MCDVSRFVESMSEHTALTGGNFEENTINRLPSANSLQTRSGFLLTFSGLLLTFSMIQWRKEHQTLSCEEFDRWISRYEPDSAEIGLERYFEENGIQCPECKFRYALSRGGCMHFKCVQCGFDFCSGCNRPFKNGEVILVLNSVPS